MIRVENVKSSKICYDDEPSKHIKEYYNYCYKLLKKKLYEIDEPINIIFGPYNYNFNDGVTVIKVDIQCEHTLVKDGGRSVTNKVFGKIPTGSGDFYLVRIDKFEYFNSLDVILEYSIPNIINVSKSDQLNDFSYKMINIAPLLYDLNFDNTNKTDIITLFTNNVSDRRNKFLFDIKNMGINHINVDNCYSTNDIINTYNKTKILINVHQTDHHHTFEELRVLPALSRGVIIISESVPLKDEIPYGDYIIWSEYDDLINTIIDVQNNYEEYYNKLFNFELNELLFNLGNKNNENLNIIKKYVR
jgi:hypothetical protein